MADVDEVAALVLASDLADAGEPLTTREDLVGDWSRPSVELDRDVVVVEEGGRIVGYAEEFLGRGFAAVSPAQRGRGIGTVLAGWVEDHARAAGREQVGQTLADTATAAQELLRGRGYVPRWESWLFAIPLDDDLAPAEPPADVTIRAIRRPDDDAVAHAVVERAFSDWPDRDGGMTFEDWRTSHLDRSDVPDDLVLIAEIDGASGPEVVGVLVGLVEGDEVVVDQLAVAREHRRRGIAQALLHTVFVRGRERGLTTCALSTDSRTGARALYEHVGMVVTSSFTRLTRHLT